MKQRKKFKIDKYHYGSFVTNNQQMGTPSTPAPNVAMDIGSMALSGAAAGTAIMPGIGTAVGAAAGAVVGGVKSAVQGSKRRREKKKIESDYLLANQESVNDSLVALNNEYGVYKLGGDVSIPNPIINIEEGELEIDPDSGKIKRKFTGINPETGGKYVPHSKGKDSKNNFVTSTEGSFIITKEKAKEYEEAIKNNDILHQNSIKSNIRNQKRKTMKFRDGGLVPRSFNSTIDRPIFYNSNIHGNIEIPDSINIPSGLPDPVSSPVTVSEASRGIPEATPFNLERSNNNYIPLQSTNSNSNLGGAINAALPIVTNLIQSFDSPNYMPRQSAPRNRFMNRILSDMPREISAEPVINRVQRERELGYKRISENTNNATVRRANLQNLFANSQYGLQDAFLNIENMNNNIRGQRANILSGLGQQEMGSQMATNQMNFNVDLTNRQMSEGRRQQFNTAITQLSQNISQNRLNNMIQNRELQMLDMYSKIYGEASDYLNLRRRFGNG